MMRFRINPGDTIYKLADLEDLSLRDHLMLEQQTAELGRRLDVATIDEMGRSIEKCKNDDERKKHPDGPWILAVCIWAARVKAGDDVTFGEAIDFPMRLLEFIPEPADRKKPAARPTQARRVSGRAASQRGGARSATKASKKASTGG